MGTVPKEQSRLVMKLFVVLALAAAAVAEPEADPLLYKAYRPWGYGSLGYGVHHPLATAGHHVVGYPAFGYAGHYIGKREAEADPALLLRSNVGSYYSGVGHSGVVPYTGFGYSGVGYAGYPYRPTGYSGMYSYGFGN